MYCQVVYLRGCHPGRIRHALSELPETLDETYERTLREINKADWELAHRLFQCVAVASRPLRVEELAEFLAFDFNAGPIAKFQEGWRLEDPVDAVLSTCSTLLALVNFDGSPVIQFSHFSVKEFLTSARLGEGVDGILRRYYISLTPAHTLVTQACLGILLHLGTDITRHDLKKYPLTEYAARHWFEHARFENVFQTTEGGMKQLFDPSKPHLGIWVWICDPRSPSMNSERTERPSAPRGTPLHYAAICDLHGIVNFLAMERPQDVDSRCFDDGWTPLHVASTYGHVEVGRILIEHGADTTAQDNCEMTPLHIASRNGHIELARLLVEHGADVAARDQNRRTPLFWASTEGYLEMARFIIGRGADPTAQDDIGRTALHWASTHGRVEIARFLLEHGACVTARADDGRTPLHVASEEGNVKVVRLLVENGADATLGAPLHVVTRYGYSEVAKILVERGADLSTQTRDGQSPLHVASAYGNMEITRLLVEHGANLTTQDNRGLTPCDVAWREGHSEIAHFLTEHAACTTAQADDERTLSPLPEEEQGANATTVANNRWTPLHVAAEQGNAEVVRALVEHGMDVAARADNGWTPLHVASSCGSVEVLRILVEHGADVTARADNGWTPLHVASSCGSVDVARFLVNHGVDATVQATDGRTALLVAAEVGNVAVIRILVEHSTDSDTTTAWPAQHSRLLYCFFVFCFFVEVYLHFI